MKKKKLLTLIILSISFIILFLTYNNDFIYKKEIMKIDNIKTVKEDISQNNLGFKEKTKYQEISGIITNGKNKGKRKTIKYEETYSSVVTEKYKKSDKVFIVDNNIDGLKRDYYIIMLFLLFILSIYLVGEVKGLLSVFSVIINTIIFYIGLFLYFKGINILFLCALESIIFAILSLIIADGKNKKTLSAIISVIVSVFILLIMITIIAKTTKYSGINFNELSFLTIPPEDIILPELLIGGLGAIMDVAITISSSISELIEKDNNISIKNLTKSSKEVGKDIMSTMTNVLFFTYICGGLPIFVLAIRNGYTILNYITNNFSLELTRFLVGSIGLIMTIPISSYISIYIFKRGVK